MMGDICHWLAGLGPWRLIGSAAVLTAMIETVSVISRFGFGLRAARITRGLGRLTFGLRIHHGFVGLLPVVLSGVAPLPLWSRNAALIVGAALIVSDLTHHFVVLWLVTGSPEFDLRYPPGGTS